jgi:uncharacterized phage protein gp47/JayE
VPSVLSFKQLLTPTTPDEALVSTLGTLQAFGFQVTSWQSGALQRTIIQTFAKLYSSLTYTIADITKGGSPSLAEDAYQDQLGIYSFDLTRVPATQTSGYVTFTSSAGAPLNNWTAGSLLISDKPPGSNGANVFRVAGSGSIGPGVTSSPQTAIYVVAEVPGAAANIPSGVPLYFWSNSLPGVTITNPPVTGTTTWIYTPGTDQESNARYGARMIGRWSALTYGNIDGAYVYWALSALPALTRVTISRDAAVEGSVLVIGATSTGGLSGSDITTITDYINGTSDGVGRRPINDKLTVLSANVVTAPTLNITLQVYSPFAPAASATVTTALIDMFGQLRIGGKQLPGSSLGYVLLADMYATIMAQDGVINVTGLPAADILLGSLDIYAPVINITVIPV